MGCYLGKGKVVCPYLKSENNFLIFTKHLLIYIPKITVGIIRKYAYIYVIYSL